LYLNATPNTCKVLKDNSIVLEKVTWQACIWSWYVHKLTILSTTQDLISISTVAYVVFRIVEKVIIYFI